MARSPVKDGERSTLRVISDEEKLARREARRAKKWAMKYRNFMLARSFRLGRRQRLWRRSRPLPVPPELLKERDDLLLENQNLLKELERYRHNNVSICQDNIKLRGDNKNLRIVVQKAYINDLACYEAVHGLESLKKVVARLLVETELDDVPSLEVHEELQKLVPDYHALAAGEQTGHPLLLQVRMATSEKKHTSYPPNLSPVEEEFAVRRDAYVVRGRSVVAQAAARASKPRTRRTALPSEILESAAGTSEDSPRSATPDLVETTESPRPITPEPRESVADPGAPTPEPARDIRKSLIPSPPRALASEKSHSPPASAHEPDSYEHPELLMSTKNKRSLATAAFEPGNPRQSIGVSPRPAGSFRRSLRLPEEIPVKPKKLCFNREIEEEELSPPEENHEVDEDVDSLIAPVLNLSLSDSQAEQIAPTQSHDLSDASFFGDSFADSEAGGDSAGGRTRQRLGRASKNRISSMKEPSLNTKMRRPPNVTALHPSAEKKKGKKKSSLSKSAKKSLEVEPVSG